MAKNNDIFRKKSLERISSPEQLNDYIKVSNPSVWLIIIAIFCIMGAGLYWAIAGRVPTTVAANGISYVDTLSNASEADTVYCYLSEKDSVKVTKAINDGTISSVSITPDDMEDYGSITCELPVKSDISANKVSSEDIESKYGSYMTSKLISADGYYTVLKLKLNKKSDGSLAWSDNNSSSVSLQGNTSCKVSIVTKRDQPIQFLTK